jgi:hypothetical protein
MSTDTPFDGDADADTKPAFERDGEQATDPNPSSDTGRFTDDWVSERMWKRRCGRCDTLVPEHARTCEECGLAFPGGLDMAGYYADGRRLSQ